MIYTPLISSWADFHQGRGNSLLSISQAWFPSSTMVVRGAGGHHGQCSGGPWWQWGSHWWTAGQVESASTGSAVGKGDNLQKGFDLNCPVQSCGCAGSAWSSEHSSPGVAAFGDLPRSLPTLVGQADLWATALWLLTALICTLSSIHSYSWVRKIPECKDYTESVSWKKKKKKNQTIWALPLLRPSCCQLQEDVFSLCLDSFADLFPFPFLDEGCRDFHKIRLEEPSLQHQQFSVRVLEWSINRHRLISESEDVYEAQVALLSKLEQVSKSSSSGAKPKSGCKILWGASSVIFSTRVM